MKIQKELDFIYICSDSKRFLLKEEAERHEQKLENTENDYKIFNN